MLRRCCGRLCARHSGWIVLAKSRRRALEAPARQRSCSRSGYTEKRRQQRLIQRSRSTAPRLHSTAAPRTHVNPSATAPGGRGLPCAFGAGGVQAGWRCRHNASAAVTPVCRHCHPSKFRTRTPHSCAVVVRRVKIPLIGELRADGAVQTGTRSRAGAMPHNHHALGHAARQACDRLACSHDAGCEGLELGLDAL